MARSNVTGTVLINQSHVNHARKTKRKETKSKALKRKTDEKTEKDEKEINIDVTEKIVKTKQTKVNTISFVQNITKTCPCSIQRFFSVVKIENFVGKILIFFLFLLKNESIGS